MNAKVDSVVRQFMPWSHSKVALAEKCPAAFQRRYVHRAASVEGTEARVGTAAHVFLEHRLDSADAVTAHEKAKTAVKAMTSEELETLKERTLQAEAYITRAEAFRNKKLVAREGLEVRLAVDMKGAPCGYEDSAALMRGSVDHLIVQRDHKALIIDHKSGREHPIGHYAAQLDVYAVLTVQNHAHVQSVQAGVHHVQTGGLLWKRPAPRAQVQQVTLHWMIQRIKMAARGLEGFPARTSPLCAWCDYHAQCPDGIALISVEDAAKKRNKNAQRNRAKTKAKREPRHAQPPEEVESVAGMFPDVEVIL